MALDSKIKDLLNKFADTQPALRLSEKPYESSNIMLGDLIESALAAEDQEYTPDAPSNWASPVPTTIKEAIDRLADAVEGLLTTPIP